MADVYIPQDVWSYIFTFIPLPKVEFNKVGFYLINNQIVRITKITKCFIWCSLHIMKKEDEYHSKKYLTTIIKERRINKSNISKCYLASPDNSIYFDNLKNLINYK